jgi:hypothetical protein
MSSFGADRGTGAPSVAVLRFYRQVGEGKPDAPRRTHCKTHPQARAGEDCRRCVEHLTECLGGLRAMRGAERTQGDTELAIGDADVASGREQLMQQEFAPLDRRGPTEGAVGQADGSRPDRQPS